MTCFRCTCSVTQGRGDCPTPDECDAWAVPSGQPWPCVFSDGECIRAGHVHSATPAHDPGLDHLLEEVAVEVLRQDAAGEDFSRFRSRTQLLGIAASVLRSMRAIDQAAGGEQP